MNNMFEQLRIDRKSPMPIYKQLEDSLRNIILKNFKQGDKMPSEREFARNLNITKVTVSRAMSNLVREDLLYCIRGRGTFVNDSLNQSKISSTEKIVFGIFSRDTEKCSFVSILWDYRIKSSFEKEVLNNNNYIENFLYKNENNLLSEKVLEEIKEKGIKGIMYYSGTEKLNVLKRNIEKLKTLNIPIVMVNSPLAYKYSINSVAFDEELGIKIATEHLIKLGHKNIVFLTYNFDFRWVNNRIKAFKNTMKNNKIPLHRDSVIKINVKRSEDMGRRAGYMGLKKIIKDKTITGVVTLNDDVAVGVINAARESGVKIPDELSVVGFDDWWPYRTYNITTIQPPIEELGTVAARLLIKKVAENTGDFNRIEQIKLNPILIVRSTTGKANL